MTKSLSYGPTTILTNTAATTLQVGDWHQVNPRVGRYSFQVVLAASSAGSTATATVSIQVSNDGVTPLPDAYRTFTAVSLTADTVSTGGSATGTSMGGPWGYIRANLSSLTTSTAGSAGFPVVTVTACAAP